MNKVNMPKTDCREKNNSKQILSTELHDFSVCRLNICEHGMSGAVSDVSCIMHNLCESHGKDRRMQTRIGLHLLCTTNLMNYDKRYAQLHIPLPQSSTTVK